MWANGFINKISKSNVMNTCVKTNDPKYRTELRMWWIEVGLLNKAECEYDGEGKSSNEGSRKL